MELIRGPQKLNYPDVVPPKPSDDIVQKLGTLAVGFANGAGHAKAAAVCPRQPPPPAPAAPSSVSNAPPDYIGVHRIAGASTNNDRWAFTV